jgi:serine protease inhibitor
MLLWKTEKHLFVRGSTEFALDLLQKLTTQDKNIFFSPYNLTVLLAMVYAGARGDTATQMAEALHFPANHKTLHAQVAEIDEQLLAGSTKGCYELRIGNRIWSQSGYPLLQSFLDVVATHYQSGIEQVDFSRGEQTCRVMNRWIEDQTAGLIKNLVNQEMLTPETRLILTSAIYFKGLWLDPFRKESTRDEEFWVSPQRTVRTLMMHQQVEVPYAEYSDVQAVALPYRHLGDRTQPAISMVILLPRTRGELDNISTRLEARQLERWVDGLKSQKVKIVLPKFRIESLYFMQSLLAGLGMVNAFDPMTADFSGMTQAKEPFWIGDLLQKAYVNVDEEGTEAAAVSMNFMLGAMIRKSPPIPVFRVDHPFLFLIRHNASGSILFIGRVNNPQA